MARPSLITAAALLVVAASVPAGAAPAPTATTAAPAITRCATPEPSRAEIDAVRERLRAFRGPSATMDVRLTIPVAFHVVSCRGEGNVPQSQLDAQVRELNDAYRGTGFSFVLASVDRTEDCRWFNNVTGVGVEKKMKQALAIDPAHHLNVYVVNPGHYVLGWSYFPQSFPEDSYWHGVVMHYGTLPGGGLAPYNEGGTLDHEVGHYLGLFHTFQGGCEAPGDDIDDTPFEASPAFGCPIGRNTCPQPGDDPIHNYMDYTEDACYTEFTDGQAARMQAIAPLYRPSLFGATAANGAAPEVAKPLSAPAGSATSRLAFRGASPNPFSNATRFRFALPASGHVSLRLYDVAGKQVAVLADGDLTAGEHSVTLRAGTLRPGMYFAALRLGGESIARSVVLQP